VKEKMKILRWECPVCKKEIYSLWREQLDWLKRTHLLRHKREKEALGKKQVGVNVVVWKAKADAAAEGERPVQPRCP